MTTTTIAAFKSMEKFIRTTLFGVSLVTISVAQAETSIAQSPAPIVIGNTISVAEDGWYQFQNSNTFEELCSGTFECNVPAGSYIVINHSNQQRWESILVTAQTSGIPLANGLVFQFPDDGWYQVQDNVSYQSICNGLSSCAVSAGSYNVINHSSGQRWNSIAVAAANEMSTFLVPDNGWYQVQDATTYDSLCEGVLQCAVSAGTYNVINLSSGDRFEGIAVGSTDSESIDPMQAALTLSAANAEDIVKKVIGVINEDQIDALFANAQNDLAFQGRLFFLSNTVDDIVFSQGVDLEIPYRYESNFGVGMFTDISVRSEYTCAAGGTIYNYLTDRVFNDCVVGNNTYNGTSGRRNDELRGTIRNYPFWNFSATDTAGITSSLTGGYSIGNLSFVVLNQTERWRDAEFSSIQSDGEFALSDFNIERLDRSDVGSSFDTTTRVIDGIPYTIRNNSQSSSVNGSFTVSAGWTNQEPISVNVSLSFTDTIREPADSSVTDYPGSIDPIEPFQWQTGAVVISANDGSSITVTPTVPSNQSFSITLSNGESIGPLPWGDDYIIDCGSDRVCGE